MATIQEQFQERMARDVARFIRHADLSGMDVSALDGEIKLTVRDGKLVTIQLPNAPAMDTEQPVSDFADAGATVKPSVLIVRGDYADAARELAGWDQPDEADPVPEEGLGELPSDFTVPEFDAVKRRLGKGKPKV